MDQREFDKAFVEFVAAQKCGMPEGTACPVHIKGAYVCFPCMARTRAMIEEATD